MPYKGLSAKSTHAAPCTSPMHHEVQWQQSLPEGTLMNTSDEHTPVTLPKLLFQKREPVQKTSRIRMALALARINRGTLIRGLSSLSSSSKSLARLLQPQLTCRIVELRTLACRLLREVSLPRQPLYHTQVREYYLYTLCEH